MSPASFGPDALRALVDTLRSRIETVVVGKPKAVNATIATFLAGGHLLIEDVPGVGKTTLALSLARCLDLSASRIQFTADLMPTDVTGLSIYDQSTREFQFHPGPVFAGIVIADEINRATPRTQSALLEAMGEGRVSVEGRTLDLPDPFMVVATQNPLDMEGTFRLPEAQRDRFMTRLSIGYPDSKAESAMLLARSGADPVDSRQHEPAGTHDDEHAQQRSPDGGQDQGADSVRAAQVEQDGALEHVRQGEAGRQAGRRPHDRQCRVRDEIEPPDRGGGRPDRLERPDLSEVLFEGGQKGEAQSQEHDDGEYAGNEQHRCGQHERAHAAQEAEDRGVDHDAVGGQARGGVGGLELRVRHAVGAQQLDVVLGLQIRGDGFVVGCGDHQPLGRRQRGIHLRVADEARHR